MDKNLKLKTKASAIYIVIAFIGILVLQDLVIGPMQASEENVPYSQFRKDLSSGKIGEVVVEPERILYSVKTADGSAEETHARKAVRIEDGDLVEELVAAGTEFEARSPKKACSAHC